MAELVNVDCEKCKGSTKTVRVTNLVEDASVSNAKLFIKKLCALPIMLWEIKEINLYHSILYKMKSKSTKSEISNVSLLVCVGLFTVFTVFSIGSIAIVLNYR